MKQRVKKRMRPFLAAGLSVAVMAGFLPQMAVPAYAAAGDPSMNLGTDVLKQYSNTDEAQILYYGDKTWKVIGYDRSGAASERNTIALLQYDYYGRFGEAAFDLPYPSNLFSNAYADSRLRKMVNAIADNFSSGEKAAVAAKTLKSGDYMAYNTDGIAGSEVKDALLWPLSTREASNVNPDIRLTAPYLQKAWWLRSPGNSRNKAAFVMKNGDINFEGDGLIKVYAVRPAFHLKLQSVLFTSSAKLGKESNPAGADALKSRSDQIAHSNEYLDANAWKVTVADDAHSGFAVSKATLSDKGVSVSYKGAVPGYNEYVSAIITDKPITDADAKITYYGRIKNCTAGSDASGTVEIHTDGKLGDKDHLYLFNEQYNNDEKTDYASALQEIKKPEPAAEVSGTLLAKMTAKGRSSLAFTWSKVKGAEGYDIFLGKYGKKAPKKVKTIKGNKTFKWTKTRLKKQTAYKATVKAYVMKDGKKSYVRTSPMIYAYTTGYTRKYTNARSVSVKKSSLRIKAGKTAAIKATVRTLKKGRRLMPRGYAAKLRYLSTDRTIATVTKSGRIKGIRKGTCYVYAYAHNGVSKKIKVTIR